MTEALRDALPSSFREAPPRISKDGNVYVSEPLLQHLFYEDGSSLNSLHSNLEQN